MDMSDGEKLNRLICAVADGDADCLDGIYEIAGGRMFAVALCVAGKDNAEDVLHDSFIKIARFAKKYKSGTNAYGWILRIVRNTALDFVRAKKARGEVCAENFFSLSSMQYSPEKRNDAIMLEQAVSRLDGDERRVIYYRYYLDMDIREIARELGCGKSSAHRLLIRATEKLKNFLGNGTKD